METIQNIYINMDDSGRLTDEPEEKSFVYGGIYFLSVEEQNKFINMYKNIVNQIKVKYCTFFYFDDQITKDFCYKHNYNKCKYKCPELKSNNLKYADRKRLLKFIKKYSTSVVIVDNLKVHKNILQDKASKGRFKDYVIKRLVKEIIQNLVKENKINPNNPVNIILNLDEQTTVSNGYYDLKSSIKEELQYGIYNYNYSSFVLPILKNVNVYLNYKNSYLYFPVQAADLIVGDVRHKYYDFLKTNDFDKYKRDINFLKNKLYLP